MTKLAKKLISMMPRKMWEQMALVLVVLVTLPLISLGGLLINTSQQAAKTSVLRGYEQIAIRAASEIEQFVKRPQTLLNSTAAILGVLHADTWRGETALVELALDEEIFKRISLVNLSGQEIVTSELGTSFKDFSKTQVFQKAAAGEPALSEIRVSEDHLPFMIMSVPVKRWGSTNAVLIAEVNLRGFWDIVDQIRIGQTGRAYVVSKEGLLLAHPDKKKVLGNQNFSSDAAVREVLQDHTGSKELADLSGKKYLKAYAPLPSLGWAVIFEQSADEAYAFLNWMVIESWILILLSLIMAVFVSIVLAPVLVNPIRLLSERMHRVAQGDFDQFLTVQRKDEIGDLMNAFNQMTGKLKKARESERLAVIGKAAAAITHELKNSLVMAGTFIGLLPSRYTDKEFLKKMSMVLPQEFDNWKNMLQDISDYSKKSNFEMSRMNIRELLTDFEFLIHERLVQNNVHLELKVPETLPPIRGNYQKLKQVLMNLMLNAFEVMPDGGKVRVCVREVSEFHGTGVLEISVEDTGSGIPEDRLSAVFDPFHTTKINGLGLGLAISREIIERHQGTITVRSRVGHGTVFTFRIPTDNLREGIKVCK